MMSTKLNWTVTLMTLGVSIWGAYTAYDASKAKQHLDEHGSLVKSFQSEIESATKRGDKSKIQKLRVEYEAFESNWRKTKLVKAQVNQLRGIGFDFVSNAEKSSLVQSYNSIPLEYRELAFTPQELGDISFINGNYDVAVRAYSKVLRDDPDNKEALIYGADAVVSELSLNPKGSISSEVIESFLLGLRHVDTNSNDAAFAASKIKSLESKLEQQLNEQNEEN